MKKKIYLVDDDFVKEIIKQLKPLMEQEDLGFIIKFGLLSGLCEREIIYVHDTAICERRDGCQCNRLDVINKTNCTILIIVNSYVGSKRAYLTIVPTTVWQIS
jgi:hypothetical protein